MAGEVARVRRPVKQQASALDEGDLVEFSTTVECHPKGSGSMWIKGGGTTTVRPGETGEAARERLENFVMEGVQAQVSEALA